MTTGSAPAAPEPPKAQGQSSSFSFISGSVPAPAPAPKPELTSSGFNFIDTAAREQPEPKAPPRELTAPSSSFGFMSAPASSYSPTIGRTPDAEPVGSGIVFGGAAAKKAVKKRTRAQKVGTARTELPAPTNAAPPRPSYSTSPPDTSPPPSYKSTSPSHYTYGKSASPPSPDNNATVDTKEAALEAARRAEEFMAQKMQQTSTVTNASGYFEDYGAPTTPPAQTTVGTRSPDDDDYAAAKAAAEEAKAQLAAGRPPSDGLVGRFFSRKAPWGGSNNNVPVPSQHSLHSTHETPAERMQREQEEIKRAVAERQLAIQRNEVYLPREVKPESPQSVEQLEAPTWGSSISRSSSWSRPPVPASPPTLPMSPAYKLEAMLGSFEENVKRAMDRVAQLRDQHKGLLDERLVSLAKERLATQSKAAAEAQQMAAAEAEDYDMADRLAAVIDGYAREKAELTSILDNIGRALAELDSQKCKVVGEVAACFARVKEELLSFQDEQKSNDKKDDTAVRCFVNAVRSLQGKCSADEYFDENRPWPALQPQPNNFQERTPVSLAMPSIWSVTRKPWERNERNWSCPFRSKRLIWRNTETLRGN